MAKYDGLIIPRSYNDYINKSDPAGVAQALQLTGVMDNAPTAQSTKPAKSGGIFASNAVIMANNKTLFGVAISAGSVVRVLFTAALTGSDAGTGLTITYNGSAYAVKVGKDGALVALTAHLIEESYVYLQAYTTLELAFDGSQFVVMGNPVVISNADFSIMADGAITYTKKVVDDKTLGVPYVSGIDYDTKLGRDLNNYKYPMLTFINNSGQYSNCPTGAYILLIIGTDNMGEKDGFPYIRQFLMSYNTSDNIKTRVFEPNQQVWTSWSNFSFS